MTPRVIPEIYVRGAWRLPTQAKRRYYASLNAARDVLRKAYRDAAPGVIEAARLDYRHANGGSYITVPLAEIA